jgi:quercetin dioxygenase-like cupin family protein
MNFAAMFRKKSSDSEKTSARKIEQTEKALNAAHRRLAAHIACIDMRYSKDSVDFLPIESSWTPACNGVNQVECQLPTKECTLMNVVFDAGATLPVHYHLAQTETIFVIEGEIVDMLTGENIGKNGVYVIQPGVPHEIHSPRGALLNVVFRPKFLPPAQSIEPTEPTKQP